MTVGLGLGVWSWGQEVGKGGFGSSEVGSEWAVGGGGEALGLVRWVLEWGIRGMM